MEVQPGNGTQWTEPDAERWLLSLENFGIELGLGRIERLLGSLGSPQNLPGLIHVVGSNGKSSVTRMIAAILLELGLSVGADLSPHFVSFAERILIDGSQTSAAEFS